MSAFVVFSMMGTYSVTPGIPACDIVSPVFEKVTIHLENGKKSVILAHGSSRQNKYVEKVVLNGQLLDRAWLRHTEITKGCVLELTMEDTPNNELGSTPKSFPPDIMSAHPEDLY